MIKNLLMEKNSMEMPVYLQKIVEFSVFFKVVKFELNFGLNIVVMIFLSLVFDW